MIPPKLLVAPLVFAAVTFPLAAAASAGPRAVSQNLYFAYAQPLVVSVAAGSSARASVVVEPNWNLNFPSFVTLDVGAHPRGIGVSVASPVDISSGGVPSAPVAISVVAHAPPGAYSLPIDVWGGGQVYTVYMAVVVTPAGPPGFQLSLLNPSASAYAGDAGRLAWRTMLYVSPVGAYSSSVSLSAASVSPDITVSFELFNQSTDCSGGVCSFTAANATSSPVSTGATVSYVLSVSIGAKGPGGTYVVTLTGTPPGGQTHSCELQLDVVPCP